VVLEALESRDMTSHELALVLESKQIRGSSYFVGSLLSPFVERGEVMRLKNKEDRVYYSLKL
jgi:hypothetical protein